MTLPAIEPLATVVVCEDDQPTLELLCDHLEADRYRPLPAPSAADALRRCHFDHPDLLLLDLRLPDASGIDVLREIRASSGAVGRYDPNLPVIILSGRATAADRVRGLTEGADDYVPKPFDIGEVTSRIAAVLRRRDGRRLGPRRAGEIFIDTAKRDVRVAGRPVRLASKEYALLCALAARGCSPSRSSSGRCGDFERSRGRARSTRTQAACGGSSTRSTADTS